MKMGPKLAEVYSRKEKIFETFDLKKAFLNHEEQLPFDKEASIGEKTTSSLQVGQLKLFFNELLFFLFFGKETADVFYIGAAEGYHIPFLAEMFPTYTFHLFDGKPFPYKTGGNIVVHQVNFDESYYPMVKKGKNVLFISDIRTQTLGTSRLNIYAERKKREGNFDVFSLWKRSRDDPKSLETLQKDFQIWLSSLNIEERKKIEEEARKMTGDAILGDLNLQAKWVKDLNQDIDQAHLKFTLPTTTSKSLKDFKYFKGHVVLQNFVSEEASETRLIPVRDKKGNFEVVSWDVEKFNEIITLKQQENRGELYLNPILDNFSLCLPYTRGNTFDFAMAAEIYNVYFRRGGVENKLLRNRMIEDHFKKLRDELYPGETLEVRQWKFDLKLGRVPKGTPKPQSADVSAIEEEL